MGREKDLDDILRELDELEALDELDTLDSPEILAFAKRGCRHCGSKEWDEARIIRGRIVRCSDCPRWYETN
jgi:hypothetical protein